MELPAASGGESIKVFVRVRPPDPNLSMEIDQGACLEATTQMTITVQCKPEPRVFTFDHVAGMETTQENVFSAIGRPIIDSCMCGYNGTIFAYGQTGSGKTFTMIGPSDECDTFTHELRGIIPRSFEYLFSHINREKQMFGDLVEFLCKCSFLEIYNEQVYDLLDPASCGLHLRENIKHGVYVDGLSEVSVSCARDAYEVLSTGWVNRKVASTSMNRESSRSHAVFTLTIESKKRESKNSVAKIKTSLLNLVDLAGSERQRDTHAAGLRLKEAGSINRSLSALGNVIMALVDIAHGKSRHVHYRDSKLTFLLRDSLGGNAKTNLVANVHPSARCFGETLSTLNFARRAKMIKNKAVVNEDASGNVLQLQAEIRRLRERLEHYRSSSSSSITPSPVSTPMTPSCPFPHPTSLSSSLSLRSDDDKTIAELKEMLSTSLLAREKTESENTTLQERLGNLEKLCEKKEKFLQSTKMILKFRETHISNIEKAQRSQISPNTAQELAVKLLRGEIEQLKFMVDHHPDVTKFARENMILKTELKKLREAAAARSGGVASKEDHASRELGRMHKYTLQLERQLRHFLGRNSDSRTNSPLKLGGDPPTPSKVTLDFEHLRGRCKHLQEELEGARRTLSNEREENHLKMLKLEASLNVTKKTNMELERSIEALKLKSSVEKATLNDIHMNTIKSMLTPRRERERELIQLSKSSSSGSSPLRRADSDPVKQLNFNGVLSSSAPASPYRNTESSRTMPAGSSLVHNVNRAVTNLATTSSTEGDTTNEMRTMMMNGDDRDQLPALREEGEGCEDVETGAGDDFNELNIEGALTDELKILQDRNDGLHQQIEELEVQISRLSQDKVTLETQIQDLTQLSRSENEAAHLREQDYLEKISEMTTKIADLTSTNTVLDSEVVDLRVCLRSADRELAELKADMKKEKKTHDTKTMDLLRRVGELEQLLSSREADYERATEELQNIVDEVDTLRNEITFKEHRISELEQAFVREKGQITSLEAELQQLLDKLALEVEKNTKLSSELQEGHLGKEKLVSVVNENSSLRVKVEQLEAELESRLREHKQQMEETEVAMNALLKQQSTDEAAISGFMSTIQELRRTNTTGEAKIASLRQEVDESRRELQKTTSKIDQLSLEVESLQAAMEEQRAKHSKELMKKDSEREIVSEELDSITEQYQQLESAFESQSSQLSHSHSEAEKLRRELDAKTAELGKRALQDKERRASLSRKSSENSRDLLQTVQTKNEEIELLKRRLDSAAGMIDSYEQAWEEKNKELQKHKEEAGLAEELRADYESLFTSHEEMKGRLSLAEQQLAERDEHATLQDELEAVKAQLGQLQTELLEVALSRDKALNECGSLRSKEDEQRSTIDALNNQLDRYKIHEEKLFIEKESLRSQLEAAQEEKAKLLKECENLTRENATITGHRNIRQKIQYHAAVKMENSKLKEEVIQLSSRLRHKNDQVQQLQCMLSGKGHEGVTVAAGGGGVGGRQKPHPPAVPKTNSDSTMLRLKENVAP